MRSLLVLQFGATAAHAAWLGPSGTPVAPAFHGGPVVTIADGAGGVLVAFQGSNVPGGAAIRLQHVDANGEIVAGWPAEGAVACSLATTAALGTLRGASDGAGGAFLVWLENYNAPYPPNGTAYVQHVLASGRRATGWAARGRLLAGGAGQSSLETLPDGASGLIAAWRDVRSSPPDIRVTRVRANGLNATGFPIAGLITSEAVPGASMETPALRPDGNLGYWLSYSVVSADTTAMPSSNHLVHLQASGAVDPAWTGNGLQAPSPASEELLGGTAALADGSGGAFFLTSGAAQEARLFHALGDASLDPAWPADGLLLGAGDWGIEGHNYQLASDGTGGIFAAWSAPTPASSNMALRRVHEDGSPDPAWPEPQTLIGDYQQTLIADATGAFVCGMLILSCPHESCYGYSAIGRRAADGSIPAGWPTPQPSFPGIIGQYLLPDTSLGGPVSMTTDGASSVIAAWTRPDNDNGLYGQQGTLRVMRFSTLGPVTDVPHSTVANRGLRARWIARVGIRVSAEDIQGPARLGVYDVVGRRVGAADLPAGPREVTVPGTSELRPGLYFVGLRAAVEAHARVLVTR